MTSTKMLIQFPTNAMVGREYLSEELWGAAMDVCDFAELIAYDCECPKYVRGEDIYEIKVSNLPKLKKALDKLERLMVVAAKTPMPKKPAKKERETALSKKRRKK